MPAGFYKDVSWWTAFLPRWPGVSFFHAAEWSTNADLALFTDACLTGYGGVFGNNWFSASFANIEVLDEAIGWKELFAVCAAVATWGARMRGRRILLQCDNEAVVTCIASGTTRSPPGMVLHRSLFYLCAMHSIEFRATHLPGVHNVLADALSRGDIARFQHLAPAADPSPAVPATFSYIL